MTSRPTACIARLLKTPARYRAEILALLFYAVFAVLSLRATLPYLSVRWSNAANGGSTPTPISIYIIPQISQQWIISPVQVWTGSAITLGASLPGALLSYYYALISLGGFACFLLTRSILRTSGRTTSLSAAAGGLVGGFLYMSQPLVNVSDLYWTGTVESFAILPLTLLFMHKFLIPGKPVSYNLRFIIPFAALASFAFVSDAHSVIYLTVAIVVQLLVSACIYRDLSWIWALAKTALGIGLALLMAFPFVSYQVAQNALNGVGYFFGLKTATNLPSSWAQASQILWLFQANNWYNREAVFAAAVGIPSLLYTASILAGIAVAVAAFAYTLFAGRETGGPRRKLAILLPLFILGVISLYGLPSGPNSIVYGTVVHDSSLTVALAEGLIADILITLCYSILIALLTETLVRRTWGERNPPHPSRPEPIEKKAPYSETSYARRSSRDNWVESSALLRITALRFAPNRKRDGDPQRLHSRRETRPSARVVGTLLIVLLLVLVTLSGGVQYLSGQAGTNDVGNLLPQANTSTVQQLGPAIAYLNNHQEGSVIWLPTPIMFGSAGNVLSRSLIYPLGSDDPASTFYLNYLFASGSSTLIQTHSWSELASFESYIGVRYDLIWGEASRQIGTLMAGSGWFTPVINSTGVILLSNTQYVSARISTRSLDVSGGLATYGRFLNFESTVFPGNPAVPFLTDTLPFPAPNTTGVSGSPYLTADVQSGLLDLAVALGGSKILYAPLNNVSSFAPASGWSGGNVADAGGFGWTWFVENRPNYSWQNSYTIDDGFVLTAASGASLSFAFPVTNPGTTELMVRVLDFGNVNSSMLFEVGGHKVPVNLPASSYAHLEWVDLGTFDLSQSWTPMTIISQGPSAINVLATVQESEWQTLQSQALKDVRAGPLFISPAPQTPNEPVTLSNISIPAPATIVTASSHANNWSAYIQSGARAYSLISNQSATSIGTIASKPVISAFDGSGELTLSSRVCTSDNFSVSAIVDWTGNESLPSAIATQYLNASQHWALSVNYGHAVWSVSGETQGDLVSAALSPNQWHVVTGEISGNQSRLYLDGVLEGVGALASSQSVACSAPTQVGYQQYGQASTGQYYFQGLIASVQLAPIAISPESILNWIQGGITWIPGSWGALLVDGVTGFPSISVIESYSGLTNISESLSTLPSYLFTTLRENISSCSAVVKNCVFSGVDLSTPPLLLSSSITLPPLLVAFNFSATFLSPIVATVSYTPSAVGEIPAAISATLPSYALGKQLYVSVPGFGVQLILGGSSMIYDGSVFSPYPSYGVTEGFVLPGRSSNSGLLFSATLSWFQPNEALVANAISDLTTALSLSLLACSTMIPRWIDRPIAKLTRSFRHRSIGRGRSRL